jgi:hypothetical protein
MLFVSRKSWKKLGLTKTSAKPLKETKSSGNTNQSKQKENSSSA